MALLFFAGPSWGGQGVGKALDEAMKSRATMPVDEVIQQFQNAAEQTLNPGQKGNVLGLLADFLMEKREWYKAIEIDERILKEGLRRSNLG